MQKKRVFGLFEAAIDIGYLAAAFLLGVFLLIAGESAAQNVAGIAAMTLVIGDSFHLTPRIALIFTGNEERLRAALGVGKQIASVTMTVFYLLLWHVGLMLFPAAGWGWSAAIYLLAGLRILLCLSPQNRWRDRYPPVRWGVIRNLPFLVQGLFTGGLFFLHKADVSGMGTMWIAIFFSFAFYAPVVLWAHKYPYLGMLMIPKIGAYLWILALCFTL